MKDSPFPPGGEKPRFLERLLLDGFRFEEVEYPAGLPVGQHAHEQAYLDLCVSGTIQERWRERTFARGPMTLSYVPQGVAHGNYFGDRVVSFQVALAGGWLERARQACTPTSAPVCFESGLPSWTAARMHREFRRRDDLSPLVLEGMLLELLVEISRHSMRGVEKGPPGWLRGARDYLHDHFRDSFPIDAVAEAVGVHPAHLMRAFRQHHGCTVGEYVRRLRLDYACHLLAHSDVSLTQVALEAGFAGQSHFNRSFKAFTSMVPTEYRRLHGRGGCDEA